MRNVSREVLESISHGVFRREEYRQNSGGAGTQRGGLGQVIGPSHGQDLPMELGAAWDRIHFPAQGGEGGLAGAPGRVTLSTGETLSGKGRQVIPPGSHLIVETPGGGGLGNPQQRVAAQISRDVANQLIGAKAAVELYGHDAHITDKTE